MHGKKNKALDQVPERESGRLEKVLRKEMRNVKIMVLLSLREVVARW
jgi:hypothetical protein